MRLLFVVTGLELGGAETQIWFLGRELRRRGWQVDVASMIAPGPLGERLTDDGIPVYDLGMKRGRPTPMAIARLARLVRRLSPDVIHSHLVHANLASRVARGLHGSIPLVNSIHTESEASRWLALAYRLTDRCCDLLHFVSRVACDHYVGRGLVSPEKVLYLPNGIRIEEPAVAVDARERLRAELGLGADFTLLSVGRLEPPKDHSRLLEAFAQVVERAPARLLIVGEGALRKELERRCAELALADRVRLIGARSDVADLMRAADALVISSASEALPLVLLEAGLCRLPVVSTAVGDVPLVVEHGRSGLLVEAAGATALADAMLEMVGLAPEDRERQGNSLHDKVAEHFDLGRIVDRWETVYAELVRGDRPAAQA